MTDEEGGAPVSTPEMSIGGSAAPWNETWSVSAGL